MITLKTLLLGHAKGFFLRGGGRRAEYVKFLVPNIMNGAKKKILKFERRLHLLKRYKKY